MNRDEEQKIRDRYENKVPKNKMILAISISDENWMVEGGKMELQKWRIQAQMRKKGILGVRIFAFWSS